jgi:hypothetical protein
MIIFDHFFAMNLHLPLRTLLAASMSTGKKTHAHPSPQTATALLCQTPCCDLVDGLSPKAWTEVAPKESDKRHPHPVGTRLMGPNEAIKPLGSMEFVFHRIQTPTAGHEQEEST